ncbi:MAG: hypothetical protein H0W88_02885 [Parachlamydiaceae bacterium]|nr:hypothetical protein [Parachlamydiaceae bacterium]
MLINTFSRSIYSTPSNTTQPTATVHSLKETDLFSRIKNIIYESFSKIKASLNHTESPTPQPDLKMIAAVCCVCLFALIIISTLGSKIRRHSVQRNDDPHDATPIALPLSSNM